MKILGKALGQAFFALGLTVAINILHSSFSLAAESTSSIGSISNGENAISVRFSDILKKRKPGHSEFYSEGFYYPGYDITNETRMRYYQPILEGDSVKMETYFGVSYQSQTLGVKQKIIDNNVLPALGVRGQFFNSLNFMVQAGVMHFTDNAYQGIREQQDVRATLGMDRFIQWDLPRLYSEGAWEIGYNARTDKMPALNFWGRQGLRFKPASEWTIDTYGELNTTRQHPASGADSSLEYRMGLRTQFQKENWNLSANIFHPIARKDSDRELDGIVSAEGQF